MVRHVLFRLPGLHSIASARKSDPIFGKYDAQFQRVTATFVRPRAHDAVRLGLERERRASFSVLPQEFCAFYPILRRL
ncbi:hypothetical protein SJ05684_c24570 [Sinorhizobium sojae CCBAU 05684]|uniref:Uncharacterized protein n=1 Tax=Sinorhizobium sojae CCBAU 05684 TaxID=716928 RepID=A0A249PDX9_9HYPH|nr:hypothetical protein SJ05684_c24570 [Sinorhizobium sojae CCBAU 05684]